MAGFLFITDPDIPGEVTQDSIKDGPDFYNGWIELKSIDETIARRFWGGADEESTTAVEDLALTKELDRTSVPLRRELLNQTVFGEMWIHLVTSLQTELGAEASLHPYLEFRLFEAQLTSYQMIGLNLDDGTIPTEAISVDFARVVWTYWPIGPTPEDPDAPPNFVGEPVTAGWDVINQVPFPL